MVAPLLYNSFLPAALRVVLRRFLEDPVILADLVQLLEPAPERATEASGKFEKPLAKDKRAVWRVLYAEEAGFASLSSPELAGVVVVVMNVSNVFGLIVWEKKTETMCMSSRNEQPEKLEVKVGGRPYAQTNEFVCLEGSITESITEILNLIVHINQYQRQGW